VLSRFPHIDYEARLVDLWEAALNDGLLRISYSREVSDWLSFLREQDAINVFKHAMRGNDDE
jgi:hypothetical protein